MSETVQSTLHPPPSTIPPKKNASLPSLPLCSNPAEPISPISQFTLRLPLLWLVVILASIGLYAFALWFGELNQDEGWYLYAGRLVSEGQHPFVDFASTQGPVMAYVYALAQPLVHLWGVAGGRLFTAILGIATALCAAFLTHRIRNSKFEIRNSKPRTSNPEDGIQRTEVGGQKSEPETPTPISYFPFRFSALLTFSLLGLNLYHVYFTTMVKTYSLAGLLVILGFLTLEKALRPSLPTPYSPPPPTPNALLPSLPLCSNSAEPISSLSAFLPVFLPTFLSAALFALAAGVRLSAGILLPTIWLVLLFQWLRGGRPRLGLAVLVGFLLGGSVVLLAIYVPFMIAAPKALAFGLLDYHSGRIVGSLPTLLVYKAGFLIRLAGAYFPLLVLGVGSWLLGVGCWKYNPFSVTSCSNPAPSTVSEPRTPNPEPGTRNPEPGTPFSNFKFQISHLLNASLIMVTLVHLAAVFPYDDYQVFIMPLLAVAIAVKLLGVGCWALDVGRSSPPPPSPSHNPEPPTPNPELVTRNPIFSFQLCFLAFIFLLLAHSASSPLVQNWLLAKRDRIWWPLRTETSLQTLQRAANQVQNAEPQTPNALLPSLPLCSNPAEPISQFPISAFSFPLSDLLLTQDTYLAVEAGMHVPPGMELGPFCYFPEMEQENAESCHVLNRAMLRELITTTDAPVAAISGYGFAIQSPDITQLPVDEQSELWRMMNSRYEEVFEIEPFGQADTKLRLLRKKGIFEQENAEETERDRVQSLRN